MIHIPTNFGAKYPQKKKTTDSKSKMSVLSNRPIVYALKQDKAQYVRGLTITCLILARKQCLTVQAFWTYQVLKR